MRAEDFDRLRLREPVRLEVLKGEWLAALQEVRDLERRLPAADAGCLDFDPASGRFVSPGPDLSRLRSSWTAEQLDLLPARNSVCDSDSRGHWDCLGMPQWIRGENAALACENWRWRSLEPTAPGLTGGGCRASMPQGSSFPIVWCRRSDRRVIPVVCPMNHHWRRPRHFCPPL